MVIERPEIGGAKVYLLKEGFKSAKEFDEAAIAHNMGKERCNIEQEALKVY